MAGKQDSWNGWRERISALRNVPAVLGIVWEAGRAVVVLGVVFRLIAAVLPLGLLWITKLIIDGIFHAITTHQAVAARQRFE
jgi:ATP-binding cassette subfamily B protein